MTVAVSCNLADGVVLGVDSAVTLANQGGGILKVYENAEKLFQLGEKPIGIAIFGMANIVNRSVGSYIREFELQDPNQVVSKPASVPNMVEELRKFFMQEYETKVIPEIETQTGKKFSQIPNEQKPGLGLAVGGFSAGAYLSEVWEILIPIHSTPNTAICHRHQGDFGGTWFALNDPIFRYFKGYDRALLAKLKDHLAQLRGSPFTQQEEADINKLIADYEYKVPFAAMPIEEGIAHVRFLVELVVSHHRFAIGAPVVGGKARIGLVTYKGEKFKILGS